MNAIKTTLVMLCAMLGLAFSPIVAAGTTEGLKLRPITYDMTLVVHEGAPPEISLVAVVEVDESTAAEWLSAHGAEVSDQISFSYTLSELDTLQLLESEGLVAYNDSSESALDAIIASEMIAYMETFDRVGGGTGATPDSAADVTIVATATLYDGMRLESTTMASDIGGSVPGMSADGTMTVSAVVADGFVLEVAAVALGEEVTELLEGAGLGTLVSNATYFPDSAAHGLTLATATSWGASFPGSAELLLSPTGGGWAQA